MKSYFTQYELDLLFNSDFSIHWIRTCIAKNRSMDDLIGGLKIDLEVITDSDPKIKDRIQQARTPGQQPVMGDKIRWKNIK